MVKQDTYLPTRSDWLSLWRQIRDKQLWYSRKRDMESVLTAQRDERANAVLKKDKEYQRLSKALDKASKDEQHQREELGKARTRLHDDFMLNGVTKGNTKELKRLLLAFEVIDKETI